MTIEPFASYMLNYLDMHEKTPHMPADQRKFVVFRATNDGLGTENSKIQIIYFVRKPYPRHDIYLPVSTVDKTNVCSFMAFTENVTFSIRQFISGKKIVHTDFNGM